MRNNVGRMLCILFLFFLSGMGGTVPDPNDYARIDEISIRDREVLTAYKPLTVTFSEAMVPLERLEQEVAEQDRPLEIIPPLDGKGQWLSQSTYVFTSAAGYTPGKNYKVRFKDGLRSLAGKQVKYFYSFSLRPTRLLGLELKDSGAADNMALQLDFSEKVSREALLSHLSVTASGSGKTVPFTVGEETDCSFTVEIPRDSTQSEYIIHLRPDQEMEKHPLGFTAFVERRITFSRSGSPMVSIVPQSGDSPIRIDYSYITQRRGHMGAWFHFSEYLGSYDQAQYIKTDPDLKFVLDSRGSMSVPEGITPGQKLMVTLLPGLVDAQGRVLKEARNFAITGGDYSPTVFIDVEGAYLSSAFGGKIPVQVANADKLIVKLYKQYPNNLHLTRLDERADYSGDALAGAMDLVAVKEIPLNLEKNKFVRRVADLPALTQLDCGMYSLRLEAYADKNDGSFSYAGFDAKTLLISDIGMTARVFPAGLTVFAAGLHSGKPVDNAEVKVMSLQNQLLAKGQTDADGVWVYQGNRPWDGDVKKRPHAIIVSKGNDINVLHLETPATLVEMDNPGEAYLERGYEAFLYTPRGVFRPGETVDIKAFVRTVRHLPPEPFPVAFSILSPGSSVVAQGSVLLSAEGGSHFSYDLPESARTGDYQVRLQVPGQKEFLGDCWFKVENYMPPRLDVRIDPAAAVYFGEAPLPVAVQADYLFGAPGSDLHYELAYVFKRMDFKLARYPGFQFGDCDERVNVLTRRLSREGRLDREGKVLESFSLAKHELPVSPARLVLLASVQEAGGRWVHQVKELDYFPGKILLGLRDNSGQRCDGEDLSVELLAISPEGQTIDPGPLRLELLESRKVWVSVFKNGRYVYDSQEYYVPVSSHELTLKDGRGFFSFTPVDYKDYRIRVALEDGTSRASLKFAAWGKSGSKPEEGSGRLSRVELQLDKKNYQVGETARVAVKAPFPGLLFFGVEANKQLLTQVLPLTEPSVVLDVTVTQEMDPNAHLTAWVYRPVEAGEQTWFPHRAYGSTPLLLSKDPFILRVDLETPARLPSSSKFELPFRVTDESGKGVQGEFSLAFVDHGVLSLTKFKTPDPLGFFMRFCSMAGLSSDLYALLIRPELSLADLLIPGGDAGYDYVERQSTKPVYPHAFIPTVLTDGEGCGRVTLDIPEYAGRARLMLVGAAHNFFASFEKDVDVGRDIVAEVTAPVVAAPGDTFVVPVRIFAVEALKVPKARLRLSAEGPLALQGEAAFTIPLDAAKGPAFVHNAVFTALQGEGLGKVVLELTVPGREELSFSKSTEIHVRPGIPRGSVTAAVDLQKNVSRELSLPGRWPSDAVIDFRASRSPVLLALPALFFLRDYPYYCLEQISSRSWPYLVFHIFEHAMQSDLKTALPVPDEQVLGIVSQLDLMQTSDGGFAMWPGGTSSVPWKSVYAYWFLQEARSVCSVPQKLLSRAEAYTRSLLNAPPVLFSGKAEEYTTKAFAAFALTYAKQAPVGWLQVLTAEEQNMYPSGRIFLAAAKSLHLGSAAPLRALVREDFSLESSGLGYNPTMEDLLRNQSLLLLAWTMVEPDASEAAQLSRSIAHSLGTLEKFTTQRVGMAVFALGRYLEKTGIQNQPVRLTVEASGQRHEFPLAADGMVHLNAEALPLDSEGRPATLMLQVSGDGSVYAVYTVRGVPHEALAPSSEGIRIRREWQRADGSKIIPTAEPVRLRKGELITVELQLDPQTVAADLILQDLLPGGMEVENPRLLGAAQMLQESGESHETQFSGAYGEYLDLREDRVLIFFDRISSRKTYRYTLRAVHSGEFFIPPTAVEGMYAPEVHATTGSGKLIVE